MNFVGGQSTAINRAIWILSGFIFYNVFRSLIFTRADYDRGQIVFSLALVGLLLFGVILFRVLRSRLLYQQAEQAKEKTTNDGERQNP